MPQAKTRAKRQPALKDLEKAIAELKALLDLPLEKRAPSWGDRVRALHDAIQKMAGTDTLP